MRLMLGILVTAAVLACSSVQSNAALVEWTLNNVRFDDGGTATGTFLVDTSTQYLKGNTIQTTPGSVVSGFFSHAPPPCVFSNIDYNAYVLYPSLVVEARHDAAESFLVLNVDGVLQLATQGTFQILSGPPPWS